MMNNIIKKCFVVIVSALICLTSSFVKAQADESFYMIHVVCDEHCYFTYSDGEYIRDTYIEVSIGNRLQLSNPSIEYGYYIDGVYADELRTQKVAPNLYNYVPQSGNTLYVKTFKSLTVTLDGNGGYFFDNANQTTHSYSINGRNLSSSKYYPTKENSAFLGWAFESDATEALASLAGYDYGEEVTLYALWTDDYYTVKLHSMDGYFSYGETLKEYRVPKGKRISNIYSNISNPSKANSIFVAWHLNENLSEQSAISSQYLSTYVPSYDIDLYASYANAYTYVFEANGGYFYDNTNNTTQTRSGLRENKKFDGSIVTPKRPGYAFDGWYDNPEFTGNKEYFIDHAVTQDRTYYAKWSSDIVSVTYHGNGGLTYSGESEYVVYYKFNEYIPSQYQYSQNFTRKDYIADGLYTDPECTRKASRTYGYRITENQDYYLGWSDDFYKISFSANGGYFDGSLDSINVKKGNALNYTFYNSLYHPSKAFAGWASDLDGYIGNNNQLRDYIPSGSTTVYAVWTDDYYTININAGLSYFYDSFNSKYTKNYTVKLSPGQKINLSYYSIDGYTLEGVYSDPAFTNYVTDGIYDYVPTSNMNLYMKFVPTTSSIKVTYKFEGGYLMLNGNKCYQDYVSGPYTSGTRIDVSLNGDSIVQNVRWTDDSKTLLGFSLTRNGPIIDDFYITQDTVLYAVYTDQYHTINVHYNGGYDYDSLSSKEYKVPVGKNFLVPWVNHPEQLRLLGYSDDINSDVVKYRTYTHIYPQQDMELYAVWDDRLYVVDFVVENGTLINEYNYSLPLYCAKGETIYTINYIKAKSNSNLAFVGWYDNPQFNGLRYTGYTTIDKDITLYAKFAEKYTIRFDANGGKFSDGSTSKIIQLEPGKTLSDISSLIPKPDESSGYTFYYWNTMPDNNGEYFTNYSDVNSDLVLYAVWREKPVSVTSVKINENISTITQGKTAQLTVSYLPENATYKYVNWSSSDETIATVDDDGLVSALQPGEVTIKATSYQNNEIFDSINITVVETEKHVVTFDSNGGNPVELQRIEDGGKVTRPKDPVKAGSNFAGWYLNDVLYDFDTPVTSSFTLKAKWQDIIYATDIELNTTNHTMYVDDTFTIIATIKPANATYQGLSYSSDNLDVATVDENGVVTAISKGTTFISISSEDKNVTVTLTINVIEKPGPIQTDVLTIVPEELTIKVGHNGKFTAYNSQGQLSDEVNWSINDQNIANIDEDGNVLGKSVGDVTVTATLKDADIETLIHNVDLATTAYQQSILDKQNASDDLQTAQSEYQQALNDKKSTQTSIDDTIAQQATAQQLLQTAQSDLEQGYARKVAAEAALEEANKALENVETNLANAQNAVDQAQENYDAIQETIAQGSLGFFRYYNSTAAIEIIENRIATQDNDNWGNTNLGAVGDATSLDNMIEALDWIEVGNELIKNDDIQIQYQYAELKITDRAMAVSQVQTNASSTKIGHSAFNNYGENLAWGKAGYSYSQEYGPYDGWYFTEKAVYDWLNEKGYDTTCRTLTSQQIQECMAALNLRSSQEVQTGHYLNIVAHNYLTTGFAVNKVKNANIYGYTYGQVFGQKNWSPDVLTSNSIYCYTSTCEFDPQYTVEEYRNRIQTYIDQLDEALDDASQALADAKEYQRVLKHWGGISEEEYMAIYNATYELNQADAQIFMANADIAEATATLETLSAQLTTLQNELVEKEATLSTKADNFSAKETAYELACNNVDTCLENLVNAQNILNNSYATATLHVIQSVTKVELNKNILEMTIGSNEILTVIVYPVDTPNKEVTWTSSEPNIVSVDENGNLTALRNGTAIITVRTREGGFTDTCNVTVKDNTIHVEKIEINKSSLTLNVNGGETLSVTITPSDATNKDVEWISTNPDIATVDQNGKVIGKKVGTTIIIVTSKDDYSKQDICEVIVRRMVESLTLDKTKITLKVLNETNLIAKVLPDNATNKQLSYLSSNPDIASIDNDGLITALAVGETTITVSTTDGSNISRTCTVTVLDNNTNTLDTPQLKSIFNVKNGIDVRFGHVENATSYIFIRIANGKETIVAEVNKDDIPVKYGYLNWTDTSVKSEYGKGFAYKVIAKDNDIQSDTSDQLAIFRLNEPTISKLEPTSSSIRITWNKEKVHRYVLQYSTDGNNWTTIETTATNRNITNLKPNTTYYFRVRGVMVQKDGTIHYSQYSTRKSAKTK